MAKFYDQLNDEHIEFIKAQKIFFTGSYSGEKGVNISPKGILPLKVLDGRRVAYLDFHGSGNRGAEDIVSGSRMTVMFCSFGEEPLILRLYCRGEVIGQEDTRFGELAANWEERYRARTRNIFMLHIESVQTSCGWGVPLFDYRGERPKSARLTG